MSVRRAVTHLAIATGSHAPRPHRGVVTAKQLLLRNAPNRGGKVLRVALRGDVATVHCRTTGQTVQGNPPWHLLKNGAWAYGAARRIRDLGPTPRRCDRTS